MTPQPGEKWVVEIESSVNGPNVAGYLNIPDWPAGTGRILVLASITPYTKPAPLTAFERRVVEAGEAYALALGGVLTSGLSPVAYELTSAVLALRAAREPADPVAELLRQAKIVSAGRSGPVEWSEFNAAIAAVEAARGKKP